MNAETALASSGSEQVQELRSFLKETTSLDLADFLCSWMEYQLINLEGYVQDALEIIRWVRPRHAGSVRAALESWLEAQRELMAVVLEHRNSLGPSLPRRSAADVPSPGDVRLRAGGSEVWVDGAWYALGARRPK